VERRVEDVADEEEQEQQDEQLYADAGESLEDVAGRRCLCGVASHAHDDWAELVDQESRGDDPDHLLRQADGADAEYLAGEQDLRADAGDHDLRDARHLLLEHAAEDVLAVDHDREVEEERDADREERPDLPRAAASLLGDPLGRHANARAGDRVHHPRIGAGLAELVEHHGLADGVANALDVAERRRVPARVARRHAGDRPVVEHDIADASPLDHDLLRRRRLGRGQPRRLDDSHVGFHAGGVGRGVGAEATGRRRRREVGGDALAEPDARGIEDDDVTDPRRRGAA
jgi:hypothetical protein